MVGKTPAWFREYQAAVEVRYYSSPDKLLDPVTRLILEGIFFLIIYTISLRLFRIVERRDLKLLKETLPHQLEKLLDVLEDFIIYGTGA